jgi:hypothetical protein
LLLLSRHYTIPQPSSLFSGRVSYVYPKPTSDHKSSYLWLPKYLGSQVHAITPGLFVDMGCSLTTPQPSTPQTTVLPISASRAAEHRCEPHRLALNDVFDESDLFYHTLKRHSSLAAATLPLVSSPCGVAFTVLSQHVEISSWSFVSPRCCLHPRLQNSESWLVLISTSQICYPLGGKCLP